MGTATVTPEQAPYLWRVIEHFGDPLDVDHSYSPLEQRLTVVGAEDSKLQELVDSLTSAPPELDETMRRLWLASPIVTVADVRKEASRRMQQLVGARDENHLGIIISNSSREAIRLLRKGAENWTTDEAVRAAQLEGADAAIEAIRAFSNVLEGREQIPLDYRDDKYWTSGE